MDGSYRPPRDPFLRRFLARVPEDVRGTFTEPQLTAVKMAFGAREWGSHAVDVRKSFRFLWSRYYMVLLMGRERRPADRLAAEGSATGTFGNFLISCASLLVLFSPLLFALYVLKSALGISVLYESGGHDVWYRLMHQLEILLG